MDSRHVAQLLEFGIMVLGGLYGTALGYRWVGKPPGADPKYDGWHRKYGKMMKWLGPAVAGFGVLLYLLARAR